MFCLTKCHLKEIEPYHTYIEKTQLDLILQTLHNPRQDLVCDYINVNYLNGNDRKSQLDGLLNSYSLCSTGNSTRINSDSSSVIDNIFIDISKTDDYETITFMNGLSDYDAQFIILNNIQIKPYE